MDWAESEEIMEIYLAEVDGRGASLQEGARALIDGTIDPARHEDLVRDAHTLKGNSRMIGRKEAGEAAEALEAAWSNVQAHRAGRLPVLGTAMLDLTRLLCAAARQASPGPELAAATDRLRALVAGDDSQDVPAGPTSESDIPAESLLTENGASGPVIFDPPVTVRVSPPSPPPVIEMLRPREPRRAEPEADSTEVTLGGLLPSLQSDLESAVMRVDTSDLYAMINRVVEIGIELTSLDDLAVVSFGNDPARLLGAWRAQIKRLAQELGELQSAAVGLVNVPLAEAIETFPQFVRFLGRRLGKEVRLETVGVDLSVDRQIIDLLREPLRHLIVNAVDHGIETPEERAAAGKPPTGTVRMVAEIEDDRLLLAVSDDGRGIDFEAVRTRAEMDGLPTSPSELRSHLLRPGFTTVEGLTDFSGTGEGLALLADAVDKVSGSVMIHSLNGGGTAVMLDLPASLVLQRIVTVVAADQVVGLSEAAVIDVVDTIGSHVRESSHGPELVYEGERLPLVWLAEVLGSAADHSEESALILSTRSGSVAVAVADIVGQRRLAVKGLGPILEGAPLIAGAAFLGGGQVLVVVDHNHLGSVGRTRDEHPSDRRRVLVVDDSAGVRQLIGATLRGNGFEVGVAADAAEAIGVLTSSTYDALVVDYSMPGSNGAQLVKRLRTAGITLPVVMVSGVAEEGEKAAAWEAGVDAYLDKYDLRQGALTESLRRLLDERTPRAT
jgi:chemotaxis protein histidine kinase CheA